MLAFYASYVGTCRPTHHFEVEPLQELGLLALLPLLSSCFRIRALTI